MIKTKFVAFEDGGSNAFLTTRWGVLTVTKSVNSKKSRTRYCSKFVSAMEIIRFQSTLGLSLKQTHKAATFFRTWTGHKSIESSLAGKLSQCDKALKSFYCSSTMEFDIQNDDEKSGKAQHSVIFFNDIFGLVEHIVDQCDLPPDEYIIKVGIDEGGGFLRVCMNILSSQEEQKNINFPIQEVHFLKPFMTQV